MVIRLDQRFIGTPETPCIILGAIDLFALLGPTFLQGCAV